MTIAPADSTCVLLGRFLLLNTRPLLCEKFHVYNRKLQSCKIDIFWWDCSLRQCNSHDTDLPHTVSVFCLNKSLSRLSSIVNALRSEFVLSSWSLLSLERWGVILLLMWKSSSFPKMSYWFEQDHLVLDIPRRCSTSGVSLCWQTMLPRSLLIKIAVKGKSRWDLNTFKLNFVVWLNNNNNNNKVDNIPVLLIITRRCISKII